MVNLPHSGLKNHDTAKQASTSTQDKEEEEFFAEFFASDSLVPVPSKTRATKASKNSTQETSSATSTKPKKAASLPAILVKPSAKKDNKAATIAHLSTCWKESIFFKKTSNKR